MGRDHRYNEARSLWLHRAIAARLAEEPAGVLARAAANVARMEQAHGPAVYPYTRRWLALLHGPRDALAAALVAETQAARDLRQCTPFAGVLSPRERWAVYRAFGAWWTATAGRT